MKTQEAQPTYHEAEAVFDLAGKPFVITGPVETITELYEAAERDFTAQTVKDTATAQKPATSPQNGSELAYTDFSTLPRLQTLRMKASAWFYDRQHDTNMLGLLIERINDDRDVRYAREMGLLSVTHCAKHEKAVSKLRGLVN